MDMSWTRNYYFGYCSWIRFSSQKLLFSCFSSEKPWKPINLRAFNISSRSIDIGWEIAFDGNTPISQCTVFYRPVSIGSKEDKVHNANQSRATIGNLRPLTLYSIRVACKNSIGLSDPSDLVNITTLQEGIFSFILKWSSHLSNYDCFHSPRSASE